MPLPVLLRIALAAILLPALRALPSAAQAAPAPAVPQARSQAANALTDSLQQLSTTLVRLQATLSGMTASRWKAPGDVRQTTQADMNSMQRDLSDTLPPLVAQAKANPAQLAPVFSVFRNVDALYDVLLRVSETAQLAGATNDGRSLEEQRAALESSRRQLGVALLASAQAQDTEVVQLRTAARVPAVAAPAAKTVVDDGPPARGKATAKRTRKPAPTPPQQ